MRTRPEHVLFPTATHNLLGQGKQLIIQILCLLNTIKLILTIFWCYKIQLIRKSQKVYFFCFEINSHFYTPPETRKKTLSQNFCFDVCAAFSTILTSCPHPVKVGQNQTSPAKSHHVLQLSCRMETESHNFFKKTNQIFTRISHLESDAL